MTAMEPPISFDADAVRAKKQRCLKLFVRLMRQARLKTLCAVNMAPGTVLGAPFKPIDMNPMSAYELNTETYFRVQTND